MKNRKICIIGAGIFGSTIALQLAKKKFTIDLYEKEKDILEGVSFKNQQRFHLGYHYPRSKKTISEIKKSYKEFIKLYGYKVFGKTVNLYAISSKNSILTFKKYLHLLKKNKLKFKKNKYINIFSSLIEGSIITPEKNLNIFKLKKKIKEKIFKSKKIKLFLGNKIKKINLKNYHKVIVCCYYNNNIVLRDLGVNKSKLIKKRYELVEKIIIKLPKKFKNKSVVILDGQFLNFDPFEGTNYHLLSVVKPAKLEIVKRIFPKFKNSKKKLIKSKYINDLKKSNFNKFINFSIKYIPHLSKAKYVKSFYTIRCINLSKNNHDRRNDIKQYDNKIISVMSGKWNTCVSLSKNIYKFIY